MTTKRVFFGKLKTVVNQFELAAMQKTKTKSLIVYLKNGTKLTLGGEDAASVWGDWKKAMEPDYDSVWGDWKKAMEPDYDTDFNDEEI